MSCGGPIYYSNFHPKNIGETAESVVLVQYGLVFNGNFDNTIDANDREIYDGW